MKPTQGHLELTCHFAEIFLLLFLCNLIMITWITNTPTRLVWGKISTYQAHRVLCILQITEIIEKLFINCKKISDFTLGSLFFLLVHLLGACQQIGRGVFLKTFVLCKVCAGVTSKESICLPPSCPSETGPDYYNGLWKLHMEQCFLWNKSGVCDSAAGFFFYFFISPDKACLMPLNVLQGIKRGSPNGNLPTPVLWCYHFAHIAAAWVLRWRLRISVACGLSNPSSLY